MNWGSVATSAIKSYAQSLSDTGQSWKAPQSRLLRPDLLETGNVSVLQSGTTYGAIGGFKVNLANKLILPTLNDIVNMSSGSNKIGEVLNIIQSMNSLKTAFNGSNGISGLTQDVPSSTEQGIVISTSGEAAHLSKLGKSSTKITNISGTTAGVAETVRAVTDLQQDIVSGGTKTTASTGSVLATKSFKNPYPTTRNNAVIFIEIDGKPLDDTYAPMLQKATVHLTHEHRMSTVSLIFNNDLLRFTNDPIWDEYKPIRVYFGYKTTSFRQVGGTFYSLGPKLMFGQGQGNVGSIELTGVSEEFMMGIKQERTVWKNMTDAQIVQQIAKKYNFLAAVQETEPVWDQVSQVNQSDWDFIEDRAEQYGYQVYIENSILHWHKPLFRDSGIKLLYFRGDDSQLAGFSVWGEPLQNGNIIEGSQIDPLTGNIYGVSSNNQDDMISQRGIGNFQKNSEGYGTSDNIRRWSDISTFGNIENKKYVYHSGRDPRILQTEVQGYCENSRWLMRGMAKSIGIEFLRARDSVELAGVGRASGLYYMTDVYHKYDGGIYTNDVLLTRTWKGGPGQSKVENVPLQLVEASE